MCCTHKAENRYKALSVKKVKADSSLSELTIKLTEQTKSMARQQEMLLRSQDEVTLLSQQRRHLEHQHEAGQEQLRQAQHSHEDARERLEEAEETCVLLQCEAEGAYLHLCLPSFLPFFSACACLHLCACVPLFVCVCIHVVCFCFVPLQNCEQRSKRPKVA
jgi:hypothetical protein